jgi:hypothetical protein
MGLLPELENQYPEGSDLTIMNSYYQYPSYDDGKKVSVICIWYGWYIARQFSGNN